jgi:glc operon protein GlcG
MSVTRNVPFITLDGAKQVAAAAETEAVKRGWSVAVAIVDPTGGLVLFHIQDGTQAASSDVAVRKARTAARFKRPTKALEDSIAGGRTALLSMHPDAAMIEGGLPIMRDGVMAGAIGISGMTSAQDGEIAAAGLAGLG